MFNLLLSKMFRTTNENRLSNYRCFPKMRRQPCGSITTILLQMWQEQLKSWEWFLIRLLQSMPTHPIHLLHGETESLLALFQYLIKYIQKAWHNKQGNRKTCSSSLDICWVTDVWIAPVQDASSLRIASSFCTSSCSRANRCSNRSFSPLCSREYVPATFFTRISSAGKITCNYQQKNLISQNVCKHSASQ